MFKLNVSKTSSKGFGIGKAFIPAEVNLDPEVYVVSSVDEEVSKLDDAIAKVKVELTELAANNEIFEAHLMLLEDPALYDTIKSKIGDSNVQKAVKEATEEYATMLSMMDNEYMRERAADIRDIGASLLKKLKGITDNRFENIFDETIIIAEDLTPSDTSRLDLNKVKGFATELGGVTSHVSIMARNLSLPALVGVGEELFKIKTGDFVIIDAKKGEIIVNPDEKTIEEYKNLKKDFEEKEAKLKEVEQLEAVTNDGHKVLVCSNVGNVEDIKNAVTHGIDGVGLFRSEFLYMESNHFPTEEEQFLAYKEGVEVCKDEVIIRTLDIGGDKALSYYEFEPEENPFLGYRAIRMCLDQKDMFKTQLRALLRASHYGKVAIMFPMIISLDEIKQSKALLEECKKELDSENIPYNKDIKVGIMIETPASVFMADEFAKYVDFFSIGTNDLTQYVLAVDRGNKSISNLYNTFNPAVLRAINNIIKAGINNNIMVGMCGEFASDTRAIKILLGMGLHEFSVSYSAIGEVKYIIRNSSYEECKKLVEKVLACESTDEVLELL